MATSIRNSWSQTLQNIEAFVTSQEASSPDDTVKTSFQRDEGICVWYVAYRWLQCVLHLVICLASVFDIQRSWVDSFKAPYTVYKGAKYYAKWLLYLTHWGVLLNMLQGFLGAAVLTWALKNSRSSSNSVYGVPLKLAQFYRNVFAVALNLSLWITVGFWALIYTPEYFIIDVVTVSQHGIGTLLLLVDFFIVKFPYKLITGLWTCTLCIVYEHMLVLHYVLGALDRYQDRPYLYEVQDWSHPIGTFLVTLSAAFTVACLNFFLWGLYLVKRNFVEVYQTRH